MNKQEFLNALDLAIEEGTGIKVMIKQPNLNEPEVIFNPANNVAEKKNYYDTAYDDLMKLKTFDQIQIIDVGQCQPRSAISDLQQEIHQNAVDHGWWDSEREFGTLIALCHSELSEALEESRNGHGLNETYYTNEKYHSPKMEGVPSELVDVVIRIMDMSEKYNIDLEKVILEKHKFNKSRPYKHGGKSF